MATQRRNPMASAARVLPLALAFMGTHVPPGPSAVSPSTSITAPAVHTGIEALFPDPDKTPGVTNPDVNQGNIADNICSKSWSTSTIRPPASLTTALKIQQLPEYEDTISDPSALCMPNSDNTKCYEEDHLISLENGGNPRDPGNLWPEPYNTTVAGEVVGARQKDQVEGFIHDEICFAIPNGKRNSHVPAHISITLARGQEILARDWYACYVSMQKGLDCK